MSNIQVQNLRLKSSATVVFHCNEKNIWFHFCINVKNLNNLHFFATKTTGEMYHGLKQMMI